MKNLILALLSLTIANHVHASTMCNDGTQYIDCDEHGGYAQQASSAGTNGDAASGNNEREVERVVVTATGDQSYQCDRSTVEIIGAYDENNDRESYTLTNCQSAKRAAEGEYDGNIEANRGENPALPTERFRIVYAMKNVDCSTACPAPSAAAPESETAGASSRGGKYVNGGKVADIGQPSQAPACAQTLMTMQPTECNPTLDDMCGTVAAPKNEGECQTVSGVRRFKDYDGTVDFQNLTSCKAYFTGAFETGKALDVNDQLKFRACRLVATGCVLPSTTSTDPAVAARLQSEYNTCVTETNAQHFRSVLVGIQKCTAIRAAGESTTKFEEGKKTTTIDGKITCKNSDGLAFDYPSCTSFVGWYNGLVAAQTGVQMYNEGDKITTGMSAQNEAARAVATGNGQEAGLEASRRTINASANAEERSKLFFIAKGAAITAQLVTFVDKGTIDGQCEKDAACCKLFDAETDDKIKNADSFFPNGGEKAKMIAEVIRAGGEAALAAMKEQELRRQAAALKAIKDQMTAPDDLTDEGVMKFCLQFPQDQKCLGPGNRVVSGGAAFRGPSFNGQNMGLGNFGVTASEDLPVDGGSASAVGGPDKSIGDIGSTDKGAMDAKAAFDAPSALRGGGGSFNSNGGGGGAAASANANGLSNDPGVEGDKKETPLKMTSKSASYEGGTAYNGGGYRAGAGEKKDADGNPFASMFGKDKGRSPSAVPEIDSPASDLFTKISNRYSEVQKRKALMEVR
jgi:hypothetical protein